MPIYTFNKYIDTVRNCFRVKMPTGGLRGCQTVTLQDLAVTDNVNSNKLYHVHLTADLKADKHIASV